MENTLCKVITKFIDENGKSSSYEEFTIRIDSDDIFYAPSEVLEKAFQMLIDEQMSDYVGKYIYYKHQVVFDEPMQLKGDFDSALEQAYKQLNP